MCASAPATVTSADEFAAASSSSPWAMGAGTFTLASISWISCHLLEYEHPDASTAAPAAAQTAHRIPRAPVHLPLCRLIMCLPRGQKMPHKVIGTARNEDEPRTECIGAKGLSDPFPPVPRDQKQKGRPIIRVALPVVTLLSGTTFCDLARSAQEAEHVLRTGIRLGQHAGIGLHQDLGPGQ